MISVRTPKVNAMLICDKTITEVGTNKKSLIDWSGSRKYYINVAFADTNYKKPFAIFIKTNGRETTVVADIVVADIEDLLREVGIEENLIAERVAIMVYRSMVQWFGSEDSTTRRMLEDILKDEEDHADDLADLISKR